MVKNEFKITDIREKEKEIEYINKIQFNISDRMMYLIQRYVFHFFNSDYEYDQVKDEMHLYLNKEKLNEDNIIFELDNLVVENKTR